MSKLLIEGLFEIHITVNPEQIYELRIYCLEKNIKPILACSETGKNKNHLMISKWKNGNEEEAIQRAKEMAEEMKNEYKLKIERVKVEAIIHNKGIPQNINENENNYFEFHLKYSINYRNEIKKIIEKFNKNYCGMCGLSFSAFKETINLLITLRVNGKLGAINAEKLKDELINKLKSENIHTNNEIQKEYAIYDTNIDYDEGWLKIF